MFDRIDELLTKHAKIDAGILISKNEMRKILDGTIGSMTTAPLAAVKHKTLPAGRVLASVVTATAQGAKAPKAVKIEITATSKEMKANVNVGEVSVTVKAPKTAELIKKIASSEKLVKAMGAP